MQLNLFKYADSESFWISASSVEDAAKVYAAVHDPIEDLSKISVIPDGQILAIWDGATKNTKTAVEWAAMGRGIVGATCE